MKRTFLAAIIMTVAAAIAFPAGFSVPDLEMSTMGSSKDGTFSLHTRSYLDLLFEGGYKFGGRLMLNLDSGDLEDAIALSKQSAVEGVNTAAKLNNTTFIALKQISVSIRDFLSLPVDFSYFIGDMDTFCSGDAFPAVFGTSPIATTLRGFSYYPNGIGSDPSKFYDGIYTVSGTGFEFASHIIDEKFLPSVFVYQDGVLGAGTYSADVRSLFNFDKVKLDLFAGSSFPYGRAELYRFGMLFHYDTGEVGEFLAQFGVPYLDPAISNPLGIDNFYFLFEPRLNFGVMHFIVTLFKHPAYYNQQATTENGQMDVNFNLQYADAAKSSFRGGLESTLSFDSQAGTGISSQFSLKVSPYVSILTSGAYWNLKLSVLPLKYTKPAEMFQPYLGVKAGF